ncbi:MAG: amidohydrolase family protein, partial [Lachnospiraceae bacterium]|nr:amidohydrolase family protein [Lachnospiraceae bacterium]
YELGGQPIFKHDGAAYLSDGTLAGSTTSLWECCRNAIRFGIPKEDAIRAATYNPAKSVGILSEYGTIEAGKCANMVLSKKDGTIVRVFSGQETELF